MKSIKGRFNKITEQNPFWSSYICFAEAIYKQKFSPQTIRRWFHKLVSKEDYSKNETKALFINLDLLAKGPEDDKK